MEFVSTEQGLSYFSERMVALSTAQRERIQFLEYTLGASQAETTSLRPQVMQLSILKLSHDALVKDHDALATEAARWKSAAEHSVRMERELASLEEDHASDMREAATNYEESVARLRSEHALKLADMQEQIDALGEQLAEGRKEEMAWALEAMERVKRSKTLGAAFKDADDKAAALKAVAKYEGIQDFPLSTEEGFTLPSHASPGV